MFDYIVKTGKFSEPISRYFYLKLLDILEYVKLKGFAHRDIKPENILLDENFELKLADFGFAKSFIGKEGILNLTT